MCGPELRGAEPGVLRVARTTWAAKLPLTSARNRPQKCPRSPKFSLCPRPPSGPRPRTSAPSWRNSTRRAVRPGGPAWHCRFLATSGKNPEVVTVRPPARQSPAGAALRPDWHVRILTGFPAFRTRRTRVGQRLRGQGAQDSPGFQPVSAQASASEGQRPILSGILHVCSRRTRVPVRVCSAANPVPSNRMNRYLGAPPGRSH
jgi:hypothetical protein